MYYTVWLLELLQVYLQLVIMVTVKFHLVPFYKRDDIQGYVKVYGIRVYQIKLHNGNEFLNILFLRTREEFTYLR